MSYTNKRTRLECIYDYADAIEREANVKPVRGKGIKPLGPRRNHTMTIRKDGDDVVCRLYATDVVTYKKSGSIVINLDGWASQLTTAFMSEITGTPFHLFDSQVWVRSKYGDSGEVMNFPLRSHGGNVFERIEGGFLFFKNPQAHVVHHIDRRGANKVRARYAEFRRYIEQVFKLRQNEYGKLLINDTEFSEVFGDKRPTPLYVHKRFRARAEAFATFQVLIDKYGDEDKTKDFYRAFLWLSQSVPVTRNFKVVQEDEMKRELDRMIFFMHRDEVFVEVDCFGKEQKDAYAYFFDTK